MPERQAHGVALGVLGRTTANALITCALVSALLPNPAAAQSTGHVATAPGEHSMSGELAFTHSAEWSTTALGPSIYGRFRLDDNRILALEPSTATGYALDLDVSWRGAALFSSGGGEFLMGNPYVGLRAGVDGPKWTAGGSIGVTLPLMSIYGGGVATTAIHSSTMYGRWDMFLLLPGTVSAVTRGGFQYRGAKFTVGADGAVAPVFPVGSGGGSFFVGQSGFYGAAIPIPSLTLGARIQGVIISDFGTSQGLLSLVPFVRTDISAMSLEARFYLNLNDRHGAAYDVGAAWALSFTGGGRF